MRRIDWEVSTLERLSLAARRFLGRAADPTLRLPVRTLALPPCSFLPLPQVQQGQAGREPVRVLSAGLAVLAVALLSTAAYYQVAHDRDFLSRDTRVFEEDGGKRAQHNPRLNSLAREMASRPVPASATTSMPPSSESASRSIVRVLGESSTTITRTDSFISVG